MPGGSFGSSLISLFLSPWWHCNENMKEEDNTEGRKISPAFLSLSCLEQKANHGTQAYQICQHDNWQWEGRGKCYCTHHSAWRTPLAGSGKETENRGKTRCGCSTGSQRHLLSKWKCASLLMKVYLLPIVSSASPVKGFFDGSVFVHQL